VLLRLVMKKLPSHRFQDSALLAILVGIVAKTIGTLLARPVGLLALRIFLPDRLRLAVVEFCRPVRSTR
jgi:hypothetical protein